MCVRYTLHRPEAAIAAVGRALRRPLTVPAWLKPRFNAGLAQSLPLVRTATCEPALWGWPNPAQPKELLANAKGETARALRTFSEASRSRRCAVPANGFYEWQNRLGEKWPHLFSWADDEPFAFAGLWQDSPEGLRFVVLTTTPNELVAPIHNRMPVMLRDAALADWLSPGELATETWSRLLQPPPARALQVRPVTRAMSNVRHEGPTCHDSPDTRGEQLSLLD